MTLYGRQHLVSPLSLGSTSYGSVVRDPLLRGANGGVIWAVDFDFDYSFPGGERVGRPAAGPPASGATVYDISEHADSQIVKHVSQTIGHAGGGLDFSAVTTNQGAFVEIPASVAADLWEEVGGVSQQYLFGLYVRLPELVDMPSAGFMAPLAWWSEAGNYLSSVDLFTLGLVGTGGQITLRRQRNGSSTIDTHTLTPNAADFGEVVQIAVYRNDDGLSLRLKSAAGTISTALTTTGDNTGDFSARKGRIGVGGSFWQNDLVVGGQANTVKWRLYRAFMENLARSERDPVAVLDADWARIVRRGTFS